MLIRYYIPIIFVLWLSTCSQAEENKTYFNIIEKLHSDLLTNYNKAIRPVIKHTDTLKIDASMSLNHLDFDEMHARFSAKAYMALKWMDPRLAWKPADYEGLETLHVRSEAIWTPDVEVYDLYGKLSVDRTFATATSVVVKSDGQVIYVPHAVFESKCSPTLDRWPFDKHECKVIIGSWAHNANQLLILPENNATTINLVELPNGEASPRWSLLDNKVDVIIKTYDCCPEPYGSLVFTFVIQRQSGAAKFTILAPTFVIVALTLATFFIPPMVGSKLVVGVFDIGLICAYLIHFSTVLPSSASSPWIVSFYGATLIMTVVSVISSVAVFSWTRLPKSRPPPAVFMKLCSLGRILKVDLIKTAEDQKLAEKKESADERSSQAQQQ